MKSSAELIQRKAMLDLAKSGSRDAQAFFHEVHHCHVFTYEEVEAFNYFRYGSYEMGETIFTKYPKPKILLRGEHNAFKETLAEINWLREMGEGYFLAGLTLIDPEYVGSFFCTEWVLKYDEHEGFIPMFCSLYENPRPQEEKEKADE